MFDRFLYHRGQKAAKSQFIFSMVVNFRLEREGCQSYLTGLVGSFILRCDRNTIKPVIKTIRGVWGNDD